jgi:hypothetical protein
MAPNGSLVYVDEITRNIIKCKSLEGVDYWMDSEYSWAIPLTEEWLLKLGFTRTEDGLIYGTERQSFKFSSVEQQFSINGQSIRLNQPKHVHQLQNLYFFLTGEDLTIQGNDTNL